MAQSTQRYGRISCMEILEDRRLLSASVSDVSPDLAVTLKVHGPTLLIPGEKTSTKLTVTNKGDNLKGAILPASMYVSSTQNVDKTASLVASGNLIFNLKTGRNETKTLHGSMPGTTPSGIFYIIMVVDSTTTTAVSGKTGGNTFENPLGNYAGTYSNNFSGTVTGSMNMDLTAKGKRIFSTIAFDGRTALPAVRTHISPIGPYTLTAGSIPFPSGLSKNASSNIDAVLLDETQTTPTGTTLTQTISQSASPGAVHPVAPLTFQVSMVIQLTETEPAA
jgi:hypothetical protein